MNELLAVNADTQRVSARDLHEMLGVEKRFSAWFETNSQGFVENEDFTSVLSGTVVNNGAHRDLQDYEISIDMAKHICLMSRTEKGKECRQYLIDLEKAWNTPEQIFARALRLADEKIKELSSEVIHMSKVISDIKPKAEYVDRILSSNDCLLTTQIAYDYNMTAKQFNTLLYKMRVQYKVGDQWILYADYLGKGYTQTRTHDYKKSNGNTGTKTYTVWTQKGRLFLYNLLKEKGVLPAEETT